MNALNKLGRQPLIRTLDSNGAILSPPPETEKRKDAVTHTQQEVKSFREATHHHVGQGPGDAKQSGRAEPRTL